MNCNVVEVHFTISWEYCISPIFSKIKDLRNHPKVLKIGADDETRDYQPVVITGVQPVKFLSTHSNALFSSFTRKSDVYNLVSF